MSPRVEGDAQTQRWEDEGGAPADGASPPRPHFVG